MSDSIDIQASPAPNPDQLAAASQGRPNMFAQDDSGQPAQAQPVPVQMQPGQTPTQAQSTAQMPTRRFERPGEFFHAVAHAVGGALLGTAAGPDPVEYSRDAN